MNVLAQTTQPAAVDLINSWSGIIVALIGAISGGIVAIALAIVAAWTLLKPRLAEILTIVEQVRGVASDAKTLATAATTGISAAQDSITRLSMRQNSDSQTIVAIAQSQPVPAITTPTNGL